MVLRRFGELLFSRAIIWHLLKTFWFTSPKTLTGGNWHRHSNSGLPFFLIWSLPRLWYGSLYMFSLIPPHIYVSKCVYAYVHISLFLPECACTTIIDISPRIFSLMYCCCVSIIFVICICPPGALIWLINLFLFHTDKNKIYKYHFLFYNMFPQMLSGCLILSPYQIYPFGEGRDNGTIVNVTKVNQTLELCLRTRNNDNHP